MISVARSAGGFRFMSTGPGVRSRRSLHPRITEATNHLAREAGDSPIHFRSPIFDCRFASNQIGNRKSKMPKGCRPLRGLVRLIRPGSWGSARCARSTPGFRLPSAPRTRCALRRHVPAGHGSRNKIDLFDPVMVGLMFEPFRGGISFGVSIRSRYPRPLNLTPLP